MSRSETSANDSVEREGNSRQRAGVRAPICKQILRFYVDLLNFFIKLFLLIYKVLVIQKKSTNGQSKQQ